MSRHFNTCILDIQCDYMQIKCAERDSQESLHLYHGTNVGILLYLALINYGLLLLLLLLLANTIFTFTFDFILVI
jgi:hypothetical protein